MFYSGLIIFCSLLYCPNILKYFLAVINLDISSVISLLLKIKLLDSSGKTINIDYDEKTEILTVKPDDILVNRFKEQKSQVEIANKYEEQYAERYKQFIEVIA